MLLMLSCQVDVPYLATMKMMMRLCLLLFFIGAVCEAFVVLTPASVLAVNVACRLVSFREDVRRRPAPLKSKHEDRETPISSDSTLIDRRRVLSTASSSLSFLVLTPEVVQAKDLKEEYRQGTSALQNMDSDAPAPREAYKKLPSGVVYADLRTGTGEAAKEGLRVNLQWVLRKSNGYFVDSSERNANVPFIFTVGDGNAIPGLDEAIRGAKAGGVRRILIPPSLAYVKGLEDGKPGPLPVGFGPRQQMRRVQEVRKDVPGEYVYLEVQLTRVQ